MCKKPIFSSSAAKIPLFDLDRVLAAGGTGPPTNGDSRATPGRPARLNADQPMAALNGTRIRTLGPPG